MIKIRPLFCLHCLWQRPLLVNFVDDIARTFRTHPDQPVYAYLFLWDGLEESPYQFTWGAARATEIPFFFGNLYSLFYDAVFSHDNDTPVSY